MSNAGIQHASHPETTSGHEPAEVGKDAGILVLAGGVVHLRHGFSEAIGGKVFKSSES